MPTYIFEEIKTKRTKRWQEGGRPRQKTKTFYQTLNPFNKGKNGLPKSRAQIIEEINAEADAWMSSKELE